MAPNPLSKLSSATLSSTATLSPRSVATSQEDLQYKNDTMEYRSEAITSKDQSGSLADLITYKKVMAANRGEIATRINRAATELNLTTVSLYAYEGKEHIICTSSYSIYLTEHTHISTLAHIT